MLGKDYPNLCKNQWLPPLFGTFYHRVGHNQIVLTHWSKVLLQYTNVWTRSNGQTVSHSIGEDNLPEDQISQNSEDIQTQGPFFSF